MLQWIYNALKATAFSLLVVALSVSMALDSGGTGAQLERCALAVLFGSALFLPRSAPTRPSSRLLRLILALSIAGLLLSRALWLPFIHRIHPEAHLVLSSVLGFLSARVTDLPLSGTPHTTRRLLLLCGGGLVAVFALKWASSEGLLWFSLLLLVGTSLLPTREHAAGGAFSGSTGAEDPMASTSRIPVPSAEATLLLLSALLLGALWPALWRAGAALGDPPALVPLHALVVGGMLLVLVACIPRRAPLRRKIWWPALGLSALLLLIPPAWPAQFALIRALPGADRWIAGIHLAILGLTFYLLGAQVRSRRAEAPQSGAYLPVVSLGGALISSLVLLEHWTHLELLKLSLLWVLVDGVLASLKALKEAEGRDFAGITRALTFVPVLAVSIWWPIDTSMPPLGLLAEFKGQPPALRTLEDPHSKLALVGQGTERSLWMDDKLFAGPATATTERFLAHLPMLLHPAAREVLVMGTGAGLALETVGEYDAIRAVVLTPSPARALALTLLTDPKRALLRSPRVRLVLEGIRQHAGQAPSRYDAIVGLLPPEGALERSSLYSFEGLGAVKHMLSPTGILALELPDALGEARLSDLLFTLHQVFPNGLLWRSPGPDQKLVFSGARQALSIPYASVQRAFSQLKLRGALRKADLESPTDLLERLLLNEAGLAGIRGTRLHDGILPRFPGSHGSDLASLLPHLRPLAGAVGELKPGEEALRVNAQLDQVVQRQRAYLTLLVQLNAGDLPEAFVTARGLGHEERQQRTDVLPLTDPYVVRAQQLIREGRFERALEQLSVARMIAPRQVEITRLLAHTHALKGQPDQAIRLYKQALETDPNDLESVVELSDLYRQQGLAQQAVTLLEDMKSRVPANPILLNNLGVLEMRLGNSRRAEEYFERAVRLDDRLAEPHAGLAELYMAQGRYDSAELEAEIAVRLQPSATNLNLLGHVYMRRGDTMRARTALVQCLLKDPEHIEARGALGILYAESGELERAREAWETVLSQDPDNGPARDNLMRLEALRSGQTTGP